MASPRRTTVERGYGRRHQELRAIALRQLRDGQLCAECVRLGKHHPMYRAQSARLDLSHNEARTGYIGLSWAACNRGEGGRRGAAKRHGTTQPTRHSRQW